jgi:hypothetical protein
VTDETAISTEWNPTAQHVEKTLHQATFFHHKIHVVISMGRLVPNNWLRRVQSKPLDRKSQQFFWMLLCQYGATIFKTNSIFAICVLPACVTVRSACYFRSNYLFFMGWDWVHSVLRPLFGLLYQPQTIDDDDCGAIGGMRVDRGNRSTRRKPVPVPHCPPQIPHDLTWARTRAAAVGSQRLITWAMAWPT